MSTPDSLRANWPLYVAPLAWAAQMGANYALEPVSCHQMTRLYFWIVSLLALMLSSASAWKGWTTYQGVRGAASADRDASAEQFLGAAALGLGTLCAVVIF